MAIEDFLTTEAEEIDLIGAILSSTNRHRLDLWLPELDGTDFSSPIDGDIWAAAKQLHAAGKRVSMRSILTVKDTPQIHDRLKKRSGMVSPAEDIPDKIKSVKDVAAKRSLCVQLREVIEMGVTDTPYSEVLEAAHSKLSTASRDEADDTVYDMSTALTAWQERMEAPPESVRIFPTPWAELNTLLNGGLQPGRLYTIGARPGVGKASALYERIPTPQGWTTMGDIKVGAQVFDENGKVCNVVGTSEIWHDRDIYRVTFSDGTFVDVDGEHEWFTETRASRKAECAARKVRRTSKYARDQRGKSERPSVKTTLHIRDTLRVGSDNRINHSIPVAGPIAGPIGGSEAGVPIGPYTLGVWLGDGTSRSGNITLNDWDGPEILTEVAREGEAFRDKPRNAGGNCQVFLVEQLHTRLSALGLKGNKHIPDIYLRADEATRLALLRGLMDTDGHATQNGGMELTLCHKPLVDGAVELIRSLGMIPHLTESVATIEGREVGPKWRINWTASTRCFNLARKAARQNLEVRATQGRRYITGVELVGQGPTRCIEVDSPRHLFLIGDFHPTHNSVTGVNVAQFAAAMNHPAMIFSLEMSAFEVTSRIVASGAQAELGRILGHNVDDWAQRKIDDYLPDAHKHPLFIVDKPGVTVEWIAAQARAQKRISGLDVVVVDYLQLLKPVDTRIPREQQVAGMSWALKMLARELDVAVILAAQLNRMSVSEKRPPEASDLRESGAIEQDSDGIIMIDPVLDAGGNNTGEVDFYIRKNRQGRQGSVRLASRLNYARFDTMPRDTNFEG